MLFFSAAGAMYGCGVEALGAEEGLRTECGIADGTKQAVRLEFLGQMSDSVAMSDVNALNLSVDCEAASCCQVFPALPLPPRQYMQSVMSINSAAITATTMKTTRAAWPNLETRTRCSREKVRVENLASIRVRAGLQVESNSLSSHFPDQQLDVVDVSWVEDRIGAGIVASPSDVVG